MTSNLSSATIRNWVETSETRTVSTGLSSVNALDRAVQVWRSLIERESNVLIGLGPDLPDVLHALVILLQNGLGDPHPEAPRAVRSVQELIESRPDLFADDGEGHHLAARFAYLCWRSSRRQGDMQELSTWEKRCAAHVEAQADAAAFLRLTPTDRTDGLDERFLSEPTVMLALCRSLGAEKNRSPARVAREAKATHRWLSTHDVFPGADDRPFFCGEVALSLAVALRHLGKFGEAKLWADRSVEWFDQTANPEPWIAKVELLRLTILFDKHMHAEALLRIPTLLETFERNGMAMDLQRCRLVQALLLKDLGQPHEALRLLSSMQSTPEINEDSLVHGLILLNIGEIWSSQGQFELGMTFLSAAIPLLETASTPWAFANLQASLAEARREQGHIGESIEAYQRAIAIYEEQGIDGKAGYLRVLLAQSLGAAGRHGEAIQELLIALPVFEREAITPDGLAAVALLSESLRRQHADPQELKRLRLQLQKLKGSEQ